ncbi:MAG: hypothetical protein ACKO39_06005, partial [Chthoniobacterales bacterium]
HNVENAVAAISIAWLMGIEEEKIKEAISRAAQMGAVRQILRKRGTRWVMQTVRCVINTGPSRRSAPATNHKLPVTATTRTSWTWISTTLTSTSSRRFPFSTRCGKRPLETANRRALDWSKAQKVILPNLEPTIAGSPNFVAAA